MMHEVENVSRDGDDELVVEGLNLKHKDDGATQ